MTGWHHREYGEGGNSGRLSPFKWAEALRNHYGNIEARWKWKNRY